MTAIENPLIPMGAITGKPERTFIRQTLTAYREKGITQYLIYPRSGCELEYLSDEWFDTCRNIIEEAENLGFTSIWLYDEFNWPSGTCNKQIPQMNPDYALKQLCVYQENEKYEIVIRLNPLMTDLMNPKAVDCFIEMTHEKYAKHFGKYMGNLIKGIFTDEPDIAYFSYENKEDILRMPYYAGIEDDYKAATGSDLFSDIRTGLANHSDFYQYTCNRLCADKFKTNFAEKISSWCAKHNMLFTGHLMNEYSADQALKCNGHPIEVLGAFSLPGMDEVFTNQTIGSIEWLTFGTAMNAVEQQGNGGGLAELFALGPCDLTPAQIRRQLWLSAMFGINKYVMAVAQLDNRGNSDSHKKFWFNPFGRTQPWFEAYDALGEEAKRAASYATQSRQYCIEVRYPYSPEPLTDLLKHLTEKQYAWKLLGPDEEPSCDIVLALKNGALYEEKTDRHYFDFQRFENDILNSREIRPAIVCEENGEIARDIFIRTLKDGTCVILNFSDVNRELMLMRKGVSSQFSLPAAGVEIFPGWRVELNKPNTMRAEFINNKYTFNVSEKCEHLRLAFRNHAGKPEIMLDGVSIKAEKNCDVLHPGFNELYSCSAPFALDAGEHLLELINSVEDYPFLPVALLSGELSHSGNNTITPYMNDGVGLYGYSGAITQQATVVIPVDASHVSFETQGLASELIIDGTSLGKRLWAPFCWKIPEEYAGKQVEIKLQRYTSCGRIFAENAFFGEKAWPILKKHRPHNEIALAPFCETQWR